MTTNTTQRYTLRLTAELEELVEARRVELGNDPLHLAYHTDDVTTAYALTHIVAQGLINAQSGHVELASVAGATTRTIKVRINPAFHPYITQMGSSAGLSTHATLRALIVAGASS